MRLNLLPAPPPRLRTRVWAFAFLSAGLAATCVYLLVSTYSIRDESNQMPAQLANQSQVLSTLQSQIKARQAISNEVNLVTQIQSVQQDSGSLATGVAALLTALGTSGELTSLAYGNNELTGIFQTKSLPDAAVLTKAIQSSPAFAQVEFTNVSNAATNGVLQLSFNLTLSNSAAGGAGTAG